LLALETSDGVFHRWPEQEAEYEGQPYLNDEFGGLKWIPTERRTTEDDSWGYGDEITSEEEFFEILKEELAVMRSIPKIKGWCYTQLTDVEQEKNGVYNYDRSEKFDMKKVRDVFQENTG